MHITRATIWTFFLCFNAAIWILFPIARGSTGLILILHALVLIWGVLDIRSQFFGKSLCQNPHKTAQLALTFDDGPDPALTDDILQLLDKYHFKATFFVIATKAQQYPHLLQKCIAAGHLVGCHDLDHRLTTNLRLFGRMLKEITAAQDTIAHIICRTPLLYRPPRGHMNPHVLPVIKSLGMSCIGWSRSASDAGNRRLNKIKQISALTADCAVILLHDSLPKPEYKQEILFQLDKLFRSISDNKIEPIAIDKFFDIPAYGPAPSSNS